MKDDIWMQHMALKDAQIDALTRERDEALGREAAADEDRNRCCNDAIEAREEREGWRHVAHYYLGDDCDLMTPEQARAEAVRRSFAEHVDVATGEHSCPACSELRLRALLREARETLEYIEQAAGEARECGTERRDMPAIQDAAGALLTRLSAALEGE